MKLNEIRDNEGARYKSKRVGRGIGSGKGKTCGSGGKGQTARSGVAINGFEGGQTPLHRRLPKRGFSSRKSLFNTVETINLSDIEYMIQKGKIKASEVLDNEKMMSLGMISKKNRKVTLKVLGKGELTQKIKIKVDAYSKSAIEAIQKAGGEILNLAEVSKPAATAVE